VAGLRFWWRFFAAYILATGQFYVGASIYSNDKFNFTRFIFKAAQCYLFHAGARTLVQTEKEH
jgi:hypothetical protein